MKLSNSSTGQHGFTLVELAIVLFIVALLLGGLLAPMAVQIEQNERRQTRDKMEEIREAIYGFALVEHRLPCPDCRNTDDACAGGAPNNGVEDRIDDTNAQCRSEVGNLPWATLGVSGIDAWGRRFTYRVDGQFANDIDGTGAGCPVTPGVKFELCAEGNIEVRTDHDDSDSWTAKGIPAIIVSHGKEGEFRSNFEAANDGLNEIFVDRPISPDFDDILVWISPHQLRLKMLRAGILP